MIASGQKGKRVRNERLPPPPSLFEKEVAHLARAEQMIEEGERRVAEQRVLIEQLRADGHKTVEAERLLRLLQGTLAQWREFRDQISGMKDTAQQMAARRSGEKSR